MTGLELSFCFLLELVAGGRPAIGRGVDGEIEVENLEPLTEIALELRIEVSFEILLSISPPVLAPVTLRLADGGSFWGVGEASFGWVELTGIGVDSDAADEEEDAGCTPDCVSVI